MRQLISREIGLEEAGHVMVGGGSCVLFYGDVRHRHAAVS